VGIGQLFGGSGDPSIDVTGRFALFPDMVPPDVGCPFSYSFFGFVPLFE